ISQSQVVSRRLLSIVISDGWYRIGLLHQQTSPRLARQSDSSGRLGHDWWDRPSTGETRRTRTPGGLQAGLPGRLAAWRRPARHGATREIPGVGLWRNVRWGLPLH